MCRFELAAACGQVRGKPWGRKGCPCRLTGRSSASTRHPDEDCPPLLHRASAGLSTDPLLVDVHDHPAPAASERAPVSRPALRARPSDWRSLRRSRSSRPYIGPVDVGENACAGRGQRHPCCALGVGMTCGRSGQSGDERPFRIGFSPECEWSSPSLPPCVPRWSPRGSTAFPQGCPHADGQRGRDSLRTASAASTSMPDSSASSSHAAAAVGSAVTPAPVK